MRLALLPTLLLSLVAVAETPKAKSVEKKGDWDVVTLESGTVAKILIPAGGAKTRGLVMAFHGNYSEPDDILRWGAPLAKHRDEIWCALEGTGREQGQRVWNLEADVPKVPELLDYVLATYSVDPARVVALGFSMGGSAAVQSFSRSRARFAGVVTCASTEAPGERGDACKGARGVFILGTRDGNYQALASWRSAIARCGGGVATWIVTDLDHELPDPIYAHDAFVHIYDAASPGTEKTLPLKPDHPMSAVAPAAPPEYFHAFFALAPEGGKARTKLAAKSAADQCLQKVRKGSTPFPEAAADSDDPAGKARGFGTDPDRLATLDAKLGARAKALKPGTGEVVETSTGAHVLWRAAPK